VRERRELTTSTILPVLEIEGTRWIQSDTAIPIRYFQYTVVSKTCMLTSVSRVRTSRGRRRTVFDELPLVPPSPCTTPGSSSTSSYPSRIHFVMTLRIARPCTVPRRVSRRHACLCTYDASDGLARASLTLGMLLPETSARFVHHGKHSSARTRALLASNPLFFSFTTLLFPSLLRYPTLAHQHQSCSPSAPASTASPRASLPSSKRSRPPSSKFLPSLSTSTPNSTSSPSPRPPSSLPSRPRPSPLPPDSNSSSSVPRLPYPPSNVACPTYSRRSGPVLVATMQQLVSPASVSHLHSYFD
jgi:hypothetical protein